MKRSTLLFTGFALTALTSCSSLNTSNSDNIRSMVPPPSRFLEGKAIRIVPHSDHSVLLDSTDARLRANKRLAYDLWRTVLNAGHVEAADRYLTPDYIQHNPTANTGREAFKEIFSQFVERQETIPEQVQDPLITIVAEGDYVVMAFVTEYPEPDGSGDTYGSTHFDMFRIENNRIAEHWDSGQIPVGVFPAAPEDGGPLPVVGTAGLAQIAMLANEDVTLANNKRLVFDTWRHIPEAGREEMAELYLDPIYIQHNPNATTGRDGFVEYFSIRPDSEIEAFLEDPLVAIVAEGNIVVQALQEEKINPNTNETYFVTWFDMFRVENGRLFEHWDTASKGELPALMQEAVDGQ
jgi:predicted SnoaL-like aldol condensation-catalyzing enzyme